MRNSLILFQSLVRRIEDDWLRGWKGFLLGSCIDESVEKQSIDITAKIHRAIEKENGVNIDLNLLKVNLHSFNKIYSWNIIERKDNEIKKTCEYIWKKIFIKMLSVSLY